MINYKAFDEIHDFFSVEKFPFLFQHREEMICRKPYKGLSIFHNIPLTMEALVKIEPLILGGADVTVSCIKAVSPNQKAIDILKNANVEIDLDHKLDKQFDIYLDCCAELIEARPPLIGSVELTQFGTELYKPASCILKYPVISVDDCKLKHLETVGTGEGFISGLNELVNDSIYNKKFIVLGCGKVGRGVIQALKKHTGNIIIIEKNQDMVDKLNKSNYHAVSIFDKDTIKKELKDTFCFVTATGITNCVSDYFDKKDFLGVYLANMGASDEYGKNFSEAEVLFMKGPINFAANEPTQIKFLDPVLYAHNISIDLLLSGKFDKGYHQFPENMSEHIIQKWANIYSEKVENFLYL